MKMRIFQRGLILVGVPFLIEILLAGSLSTLLYQSAQERIEENRFRKYSSEIASLLGNVASAPLAIALALQFRSDKMFLEYKKQEREALDSLTLMPKIIKDLPEIPQNQFLLLSNSVQSILRMTHNLSNHREAISSGEMPLEAIQGFQSELANAKRVVAVQLNKSYETSDQMLERAEKKLDNTRNAQQFILGAVFVLNLIMAMLLAWFYQSGIVKRIKTIARNTNALSSGESLAPELKGSDEIAQFDHAFHSMLEQLQNAAKNEQELFENASDVICVLDSELKFIRVNPASQKNWGIDASELNGQFLNQLLVSEDMLVVNSAIQEARGSLSAVSFEARVMDSSKTVRVGLWSAYWSAEEQKLFCIVHDVSERKVIETAKKQFLTMISSDLKIPLAKISDVLKKLPELAASSINDLGKDRLKMAQKAVERLLSLVNDLLEVAQMESGEFVIAPQDTSVLDLLRRAVADVEPLAKAKNLQIEIESDDAEIYVDSDRTMQVLVNLLSNAIKFSADDKKIILSVRNENRQFKCRVIDQGRGVPESHKTSIFERFSQVEKQDGKRKAGTGLGLPICKQIVEKHGGKIGVDSNEGRGSIFWFTIPLKNVAIAASAGQASEIEQRGMRQSAATSSQSAATAAPLAAPLAAPSSPAAVTASKSAMNSSKTLKAPIGTSLPLGSKGFVLIGIPVIFELIFVAILSNSLLDIQKERTQELHYRQMAEYASKVSKSVLYASSVVTDDSDKFAWDQMQRCYREWSEAQYVLEKLVDDDPYAKEEFEKLRVQSRRMKAYRDSLLQQKYKNSSSGVEDGLAQKMRFLPSAVALNLRIKNIIQHAESREFLSPEKELERVQFQFSLLGIGVVLNILVSLALAKFFGLSISRRILIMANNAERLADDEPLNPVMPGADELAELDRSFHHTANLLSEARKKERAVFDNSRDVLCIISPSSGFLSVNSVVEDSWGYTKKELLNASLESLIVPSDLPLAKSRLLGEIDGSKGETLECQITKKDGETLNVLWSASRNKGESNTFCVIHDISDRVALELLRKDFLAMVSHDLRTPLTAVNGVTQLMKAGAFGQVSEPVLTAIEEIKRNADSLLELIGDILDFEKLDSGKMELNKESIFVSDIISDIAKQCRQANCRLKIASSLEDIDTTLAADRERLAQSISNLVRFLSLHSEKEVSLNVSDSSQCIQLLLVDQGPPLNENAALHLFNRIKDPLHSSKFEADLTFHSDLLLPLAAKTIQSHGGTVVTERLLEQNVIRILIPAESTVLI